MPGPDMLIGVNMAKIAANARMAEANDIIDDIADERDALILKNRQLEAKLREVQESLDGSFFRGMLAAYRCRELAEALKAVAPHAEVLKPEVKAKSRKFAAAAIIEDPENQLYAYRYDAEADELRRR